jgi:alpha-methylacyl-CoA racemase
LKMGVGPLQDLKILDFSTLLPGPCATLILADLGAEVLWVESPKRRDLIRELKPHGFQTLFRNKQSLCLDLRNSSSKTVIHRLVREYDVILEGFRPGVMKRLGLDYETLSQLNPALVYCSCTGFGQTSPRSDRGTHDINLQALAGILSFGGTKEHGPPIDGVPWADLMGGTLFILSSILSAIHHRTRTGEGQYLDVSMLDGALFASLFQVAQYLQTGEEPLPQEDLLNGGSHYGIYATRDQRFLSVGSLEPVFLEALAEGLGEPTLLSLNDRGRQILLTRRIAEKTLGEWIEIFKDSDACVEPVLKISESLQQPHLKARGTLVEVPGEEKLQKQVAHPVRYSKTPASYRNIGPAKGRGAKEALTRCGFSQTELNELEKGGIFGEHPPS